MKKKLRQEVMRPSWLRRTAPYYHDKLVQDFITRSGRHSEGTSLKCVQSSHGDASRTIRTIHMDIKELFVRELTGHPIGPVNKSKDCERDLRKRRAFAYAYLRFSD